MTIYQIFGCRAFANIPKQVRRKNLDARAVQGIFVGLDRTSYPGYMVYTPEFRTTYVSGDVTFHPNERYDGTWSNHLTGDPLNPSVNPVPVEEVEKYKYLVGTNHLDPDNGLLYKVLRVEKQNYRGQGTFIVAYRAQVLANGRISTKCDKDAYHVRDIEKYYRAYSDKIKFDFPGSLITGLDKGISNENNIHSKRVPVPVSTTSSTDNSEPILDSGGASAPRRVLRSNSKDSTALVEDSLPLYYPDKARLLAVPPDESEDISYNSDVLNGASGSIQQSLYVESAMCGDAIVHHCLSTGVEVKPDEPEPNTIKQAYALPDRGKWREAVDTEMDMIKHFNVFSFPMLLPSGAKALYCRWVFKR
jgi:hypothetical protein